MEDGAKRRDLEDRTFRFAESVRAFVKPLPRTVSNAEDVRQLVRASGSVAANWIEADEALSKKDFLMRVKICRKEAKECRLFLRLIDTGSAKGSVGGSRRVDCRGSRISAHFLVDHLEERVMTDLFFWILAIVTLLGIWGLGFGAS